MHYVSIYFKAWGTFPAREIVALKPLDGVETWEKGEKRSDGGINKHSFIVVRLPNADRNDAVNTAKEFLQSIEPWLHALDKFQPDRMLEFEIALDDEYSFAPTVTLEPEFLEYLSRKGIAFSVWPVVALPES